MKIKFKGPEKDKKEIENLFKEGSVEFVIFGEDYELKKVDFLIDTIIGESGEEYLILKCSDIIYAESYGHIIYCHTLYGSFEVREKLYEIEGMFQNHGFIRVHKSFVVNKNHINKIIPEFNRKFTLRLSNNKKIEVSRRYFENFKKFIGM